MVACIYLIVPHWSSESMLMATVDYEVMVLTNRLHYNNDSWHHHSWFGWIWPGLFWPTCQPHLSALFMDNKTTQQMKKCYLAPVVTQQLMRNVECSVIKLPCIKFRQFVHSVCWLFIFLAALSIWYNSTTLNEVLCEHFGVWNLAPGYLGSALKVSWHLPLIPEHLPSFICRLELRPLIVDFVVIYSYFPTNSLLKVFYSNPKHKGCWHRCIPQLTFGLCWYCLHLASLKVYSLGWSHTRCSTPAVLCRQLLMPSVQGPWFTYWVYWIPESCWNTTIWLQWLYKELHCVRSEWCNSVYLLWTSFKYLILNDSLEVGF